MPTTPLGRMLLELLSSAGPLLLVIPLLIVAAEYGRLMHINVNAPRRRVARCSRCERSDHAADARFCKSCGTRLPGAPQAATATG